MHIFTLFQIMRLVFMESWKLRRYLEKKWKYINPIVTSFPSLSCILQFGFKYYTIRKWYLFMSEGRISRGKTATFRFLQPRQGRVILSLNTIPKKGMMVNITTRRCSPSLVIRERHIPSIRRRGHFWPLKLAKAKMSDRAWCGGGGRLGDRSTSAALLMGGESGDQSWKMT